MGLVVSICKKFKPKNLNELDELVQAGRIGLWKAIVKHNAKKAKLSTIAWRYIRWEILKHIENNKTFYTTLPHIEKAYNTNAELWEFIPDSITDLENKVLKLRLLDGRPFIEIGKMTGLSKSWVYSIYNRAISKIKDANKKTNITS